MEWTSTRASGLERLAEFVPLAGHAYANNRNHDDGPDRTNVSMLSPWLHSGLLREAEVIDAVLAKHSLNAAEKFIAEVFWRIYFKGYLEQRPEIWRDYYAGRDAALAAHEANAGHRAAYCKAVEGRTGIAAFDHWARELVETGYLHNHARMWFASIWIFTLKLDWHLGADFFLRHLVDADAASNTLSWRWVGGLHTKGKTYLARRDNIARYTANHPRGPLGAEGLSDKAIPLDETANHPRRDLDLPGTPPSAIFDAPYALLLHDEAASHVPLDLAKAPSAVIGAARPAARSPGPIGELAGGFATGAVHAGMEGAAAAFGCPMRAWMDGTELGSILDDFGVERIAVPYLPCGWTRDALIPQIQSLTEAGRAVFLLDDLNRTTWPHAKAGFFGVRKKIDAILRELGITGTRDNAPTALSSA